MSAFDGNPQTEVQLLTAMAERLGISPEFIGQTEVPLLKQILAGMEALIEEVEQGGGGGGGDVSSVFGRTGAVTAQNADYTAAQVGADAAGAAAAAQAAAIAAAAADATSKANAAQTAAEATAANADNLSSGTIPDARFPAALPAISGANLTNLPAGTPIGLQWQYAAGGGSPASGKFTADAGGYNSITEVKISTEPTSPAGDVVGNYLLQTLNARLQILRTTDNAIGFYSITSLNDGGTFVTFTVSYIGGTGTLAANDNCILQFIPKQAPSGSQLVTSDGNGGFAASAFSDGDLTAGLFVADSGWTANADAGDKTAVIPDAAALATIATALDIVVAGAGAALLAVAEKCKALETVLASQHYPNV